MSISKKNDTHELLVRLKHGEAEVIEILYSRYARAFYAYARRRGLSHEDAEDVIQMVFDRILTRMQTYSEPKGGGEGWVWQTYSRMVIDMQRSRHGQTVVIDKTPSIPDMSTIPDDRFLQNELYRCIQIAWKSIPESDRVEILRVEASGSGRHSKLWHQAMQRLRGGAEKCKELL